MGAAGQPLDDAISLRDRLSANDSDVRGDQCINRHSAARDVPGDSRAQGGCSSGSSNNGSSGKQSELQPSVESSFTSCRPSCL